MYQTRRNSRKDNFVDTETPTPIIVPSAITPETTTSMMSSFLLQSSPSSASVELPPQQQKKKRGRPKGRKTSSHPLVKRPKRPPSAYNLFFADEKTKMQQQVDSNDNKDNTANTVDGKEDSHEFNTSSPIPEEVSSSLLSSSPRKKKRGRPDSTSRTNSNTKKRVRRTSSLGMSFPALAKIISERWKNIDAVTKTEYQKTAKKKLTKHKELMKAYHKEVEEITKLSKDMQQNLAKDVNEKNGGVKALINEHDNVSLNYEHSSCSSSPPSPMTCSSTQSYIIGEEELLSLPSLGEDDDFCNDLRSNTTIDISALDQFGFMPSTIFE